MLVAMVLGSVEIFVSEVAVSPDTFGKSDSVPMVQEVISSVTGVCFSFSGVKDVFVFTVVSDFDICIVDVFCVSVVVV